MEVMMINDPFSRLNVGFGWDLKKKKKALEQLLTEVLSMLYKYGPEELYFSHGKDEK